MSHVTVVRIEFEIKTFCFEKHLLTPLKSLPRIGPIKILHASSPEPDPIPEMWKVILVCLKQTIEVSPLPPRPRHGACYATLVDSAASRAPTPHFARICTSRADTRLPSVRRSPVIGSSAMPASVEVRACLRRPILPLELNCRVNRPLGAANFQLSRILTATTLLKLRSPHPSDSESNPNNAASTTPREDRLAHTSASHPALKSCNYAFHMLKIIRSH